MQSIAQWCRLVSIEWRTAAKNGELFVTRYIPPADSLQTLTGRGHNMVRAVLGLDRYCCLRYLDCFCPYYLLSIIPLCASCATQPAASDTCHTSYVYYILHTLLYTTMYVLLTIACEPRVNLLRIPTVSL